MKRSLVWLGAGEWLINRRWWLVALASLSIFIFEFLEYLPHIRGVNTNFFFEILFYGVLLPLSTGLALSWLAVSRAEMIWSTYYQNLIHNLGVQLHNAHSYDALAEMYLQFVKVIVPLVGAEFYKYDQRSKTYTIILNWSLNQDLSFSDSISDCTAEGCRCLIANAVEDAVALQPCRDPRMAATLQNASSFCIPFLFSNIQIAGARLYFPIDSPPSPEQMRLLSEIAPFIASVFQRVQFERVMKRRDDSMKAEARRIARDVHDTLGHSLAYLRLRLDQISGELNQTDMNIVRKEVETLRDTAKESYNQMRDVLVALTPEDSSDLNGILLHYVDMIQQRGNHEINFRIQGQPHVLLPAIQRHVFFIFREALTNIEKHSHAREVNVDLNWQESGLEINIADDGTGFDTTLAIRNGHFGLKNMQERAMESDAQLLISSRPGHGTRLKLSVAYKDET